MKKSIYNVYIEPNNLVNEYYVFNTWKGSLINLEEFKFKQLLNDNFSIFDKTELDTLYSLGMITNIENEYYEVLNENNNKKLVNREFAICISPTTACNARCSYCFENGTNKSNMTYEVADQIIEYIKNNYKGRLVYIRWFGGEPLVNSNMIDYICDCLQNNKIEFTSSIVTNGYLVDENIDKMKNIWHIKHAQITLDDLYDKYNSIKNFIPTYNNPFLKIINNIHLLAFNRISVAVRINFDSLKVDNAIKILKWVHNEFKNEKFVTPYCSHLQGNDFISPLECEKNPYIKIFTAMSECGYIYDTLKSLKISRKYRFCSYTNQEFFNVDPNGFLYNCEHYVGRGEALAVGKIENVNNVNNFNHDLKEECKECVCFPICAGGCISLEKEKKNAGCLSTKNILDYLISIWINYRKELSVDACNSK